MEGDLLWTFWVKKFRRKNVVYIEHLFSFSLFDDPN